MGRLEMPKGSKEHKMFRDYFLLAQKHGTPENLHNESYWSELANDVSAFLSAYDDVQLASFLGLALIDCMDQLAREEADALAYTE